MHGDIIAEHKTYFLGSLIGMLINPLDTPHFLDLDEPRSEAYDVFQKKGTS